MTNMTNLHTCSVGRVNLISARVAVADGEAVEVAGDVVRGSRVHVRRHGG